MSVFNTLCRTSSGKQFKFVRSGEELFACRHDSGAIRANFSVGKPRARSQFFATFAPHNIQPAFISHSIAALRNLARIKRACEFDRVRGGNTRIRSVQVTQVTSKNNN
jgi:hypothetical protein